MRPFNQLAELSRRSNKSQIDLGSLLQQFAQSAAAVSIQPNQQKRACVIQSRFPFTGNELLAPFVQQSIGHMMKKNRDFYKLFKP